MSLFELCELAEDRCFVELVLLYSPGQEQIRPHIHPLGKRQLTRDEWRQFMELVETWYASTTDEEIARHNAQFPGRQAIRPAPEKTKCRQRHGFIYVLMGDQYYKIGQSVHPPSRVEQIEPKMPFPIEIVHTFKVEDMNAAEKELHEHFANKRTQGEWFLLDEADVEWLKNL